MIKIPRKSLVAYAFFLFWPFLSLIHAIINYREKYAKNIVWLFTCFYGFTFVIYPGGDSVHYRDYFLYIHSSDFSSIDFFQALLRGEEGRGDYYEPIVSFIIAQFTDDYRYLFLVFATVFGFFFSRGLWMIIDNFSIKLKPLTIVFLIFLVTILPIWNINGVRFHTASIIFCYALLSYYLKGQKKSILLILLTPFVHFSFYIAVGLFLMSLLLSIVSVKRIVYIGLFVFGVFLSNFEIETLLNFSFLVEDNEHLTGRINAYTQSEFIEGYFNEDRRSWFMKIKDDIWRYSSIFIIVFLLGFNYEKIKEYELDKILFMGVIIFSVTAVLNVIPSMQRFFTLSSYLLTATLILFYQKSKSNYWMNVLSPALGILLIFLSFIQFRVGWQSMNITLLFSNPLLAPFFENTVSISDFYEGNI